MTRIRKITIIGSGNVGFHLGNQLHKKGFEIAQIFSRQLEKASFSAELTDAEAIDNFSKINLDTDLFIIAVSDNAIANVAKKLKASGVKDQLVVHTSGATPSTILNPYFDHFGVFYPLQTFKIHQKPKFKILPLCIDAFHKSDLKKLRKVAKKICKNVHQIDDQERAILHVAAVFANNFSNHLFAIAEDILQSEKLSFQLLIPLIQETARKLQLDSPKDLQTGPAIRADENTIKKHLLFLEKHPDYRSLYLAFSKSINPKFGDYE